MKPTAAQSRVLAVLERTGGQWVHVKWLDSTPLLHEDDFPTLPSLIENGWVDHRLRSVQITPAGLKALQASAKERH